MRRIHRALTGSRSLNRIMRVDPRACETQSVLHQFICGAYQSGLQVETTRRRRQAGLTLIKTGSQPIRGDKTLTAWGSFHAEEVKGFSRWPWRPSRRCISTNSKEKPRCNRPSLSRRVMSQFRRTARRIQAQKGEQGNEAQRSFGFTARMRALARDRSRARRKSCP